MNVVREINQLNEKELDKGKQWTASWHDEYKGSAYIFVANLDYGLNEGDILTVFSQFGEIVDLNLIRDKETGQSKGYCFLCYEDQRSTILAVDNFNGSKLAGRTLRVDHVKNYKKKEPKYNNKNSKDGNEDDDDEETFSDSDLEEEDRKYKEKARKVRDEEETVPLWKRLWKYEKRQRKKEKKEEKKERKEHKRKKRKREQRELMDSHNNNNNNNNNSNNNNDKIYRNRFEGNDENLKSKDELQRQESPLNKRPRLNTHDSISRYENNNENNENNNENNNKNRHHRNYRHHSRSHHKYRRSESPSEYDRYRRR